MPRMSAVEAAVSAAFRLEFTRPGRRGDRGGQSEIFLVLSLSKKAPKVT
jgi:hypothetical protein